MTETKPCVFREDGDDLEKAYRAIIEEEIPEYVRFWEQYIGVRRGPGGRREPYRLVPAGNDKLPDGLTNWHWATCETHYSFLHHWLETRKHMEALAYLYATPSMDEGAWCEAHLRAFECGMMRVGNALNMINRLWCLLGELRKQDSKGQKPDFYVDGLMCLTEALSLLLPSGASTQSTSIKDRLIGFMQTRNYVVHAAGPVMYANDTPERCGQPMIPYVNQKEPFRGWRRDYKGALPTKTLLESSFRSLTELFRISESNLHKKVWDMLKARFVTFDWGQPDESVFSLLEICSEEVKRSESAVSHCPLCRVSLKTKTEIAFSFAPSDTSSAQREMCRIELHSPCDPCVRDPGRRFRELYCPNCGYEE